MWQPISRVEFDELLARQEADFGDEDRRVFEQFRTPVFAATIRRSATVGDESVFVVARSPLGALYFDDVEYGFNFSPIDDAGNITQPGGSQMELRDAIRSWLAPQMEPGCG